MNIHFLFENGKGSVVDEYGRPKPMDYIVNEEQSRLETLSSHTKYLAQLPLESENEVEWGFSSCSEKCLSAAAAAAKQLGIHVRTAQKWAAQYERDPDCIFEKRRKTGRPRILKRNTRMLFSNALMRILQSSSTNEEKIQGRLDWVHKWERTDMDFTRNCVFLDESAFHINLKRSVAWSKKGTPAVVTVPKTRATTILGAISAEGLIKCSLRLPQSPANKKRKRGDGVGYMSKGMLTGHYAGFLKAPMDEMDQYPHMKDHYLVMDNAPIHTSEYIAKYVESRGYRCAYLPSYSLEIKPIEQFWSVVKSKVKRNRFLEKETLMTWISETSHILRLSGFKGIVRHSHKCLDKCRNYQPL
ncbi:hypothetical protein G6F43_000955 [Rhizopus delemar]|nr:hypothetical protein G6F43_000955 [Rhizopus delemar]